MADLWPADFGKTPEKGAFKLMSEQVPFLTAKTSGLVIADVGSFGSADGTKYTHKMDLVTADGKRTAFLHAEHGLSLYPATLTGSGAPVMTANDVEFTTALGNILGSQATKTLVHDLMAQVIG